MPLIRIDRPDDPRVAPFRAVKERDLTGREGLFIAEGEVVIRVLASPASRCSTEALLLAENRLERMADVIAALPDTPVLVAGQAVLDGIAGFHLHRGMLALGRKPEAPEAADLLASLPSQGVVVVVGGVGNHDNMGGIFRSAAAFGAAAVLLDDRCCDPFYRKAIRVSVGAVLRTPQAAPAPLSVLADALETQGFEAIALTPSASEPLHLASAGGRVALLLGSEGPGLPPEIISRCKGLAIPMSGGFDSLNVATAGAIALHHFTRARGRD